MRPAGTPAGPGDSYSTYSKAREKVNELIEKVFSRDILVTVKIVCMEG